MAKDGTLENKRLVQLAQNGDRKAFSELVRIEMNKVVALTYRMTGDKESAYDLAQETFITVWQKLSDFRGEASFSSWIYRIASNKTLNYLKSYSRNPEIDSDALDQQNRLSIEQANPHEELEHKELRVRVLKFMRSLPDQQRLAFELRFYKQLKFEEIAEVTGSALGTVKTNYREAVKKLRRVAKEEGLH